MAENKSDFIRDSKVLNEEAQKIVTQLRDKLKLSIAQQSSISVVTKKRIGDIDYPVVHLRNITKDFKKLLTGEGWMYGRYYLEGSSKTGFYKMKEGKYMFIEVEEEYNTLSTEAIDNAEAMKRALIAKNPLLDDTNVHVDGATITIGVPFLDHLEMPSSEWEYDAQTGKIHSTSREYAFDIVVTNAASMNDGYKTADGTTGAIMSREALSSDNEREALSEVAEGPVVDSESVNLAAKNNLKIDLADFSPKNMYEVFLRCHGTINENGEFQCFVKDASQDGSFRSIDARQQENSASNKMQQIKEWAFVNMLWIDACKLSYNDAAQAFEDRIYSSVLVAIMESLREGERSADVILKKVGSLDSSVGVEIAYTFLSSLTNVAGFEIDFSNVNFDNLEQYKENENDQGMPPPTMNGPKPTGF